MQNLSQGNVDVPLNANGIEQAHAAASVLRDKGIATIIASPLSRARVTAEIVAAAAAAGVAVQFDAALREVAFGAQEGKPMQPWFDDWIAGTFTPLEAETFAALRTRAVAAIGRALAHPAPVLVVGHGAFFRALRSAMGLAPNVRLANAVPLLCAPGDAGWHLLPA